MQARADRSPDHGHFGTIALRVLHGPRAGDHHLHHPDPGHQGVAGVLVPDHLPAHACAPNHIWHQADRQPRRTWPRASPSPIFHSRLEGSRCEARARVRFSRKKRCARRRPSSTCSCSPCLPSLSWPSSACSGLVASTWSSPARCVDRFFHPPVRNWRRPLTRVGTFAGVGVLQDIDTDTFPPRQHFDNILISFLVIFQVRVFLARQRPRRMHLLTWLLLPRLAPLFVHRSLRATTGRS